MRWIILIAASWSAVSAQPKKIVATGMSPEQIQAAQGDLQTVRIVAAESGDAFLKQIADADALWGQQISPEVLKAAPKLKWVQTYSAGVEHLLSVPEFKDSNITLSNCKIVQGPNIADHAFALLLALTRGTGKAAAMRTSEAWDRRDYRLVELSGKTALIIGVGGIGQQIAQRAKGFGMTVIGVDPEHIPANANISKVFTPDEINNVIGQADVIFVSAPHTPQSEGMIGPSQFERMKKDAYFIAVSRGKLYDTPALVKALDSQRLAGAGLDVTDPEPLPKGHSLWKFDNVIITPHVAGQSDIVWQRRMALLKENAKRFGAGLPLMNVVDKQKGY
jgi:phosphoglycerate dehydrogenase-like enzyme